MRKTDWLWQLAAGVVAGGFIASAFMISIGMLFHYTSDPRSLPAQYLMWACICLWLFCLCITFLWETPQKSWTILGYSSVALWAIVLLLEVGLK